MTRLMLAYSTMWLNKSKGKFVSRNGGGFGFVAKLLKMCVIYNRCATFPVKNEAKIPLFSGFVNVFWSNGVLL